MSSDSISTIIPTYNRAHLLGRALDSVLIQLEERDEVIVVDDGSTDDTEQLVRQYEDRVRYEKGEHRGAGAARNLGLKLAHNPLITFLDSDDEWLPGKIALQRAFMNARPDLDFCLSDFRWQQLDNEVGFALTRIWFPGVPRLEDVLGPATMVSTVVDLPEGVPDVPFHEGDMYRQLLEHTWVQVNTTLIRASAIESDVRFAEDTKTYEEWEFFGKLARAGAIAYLSTETARLHAHPGERLTNANWHDMAEARIPILERVWGSDFEFLRVHKEAFDRVVQEQLFAMGRKQHSSGQPDDTVAPASPADHPAQQRRLLKRLMGALRRSLSSVRQRL